MTIWLPNRMYHAFPPVCMALGVIFLLTAPGPVSIVLSVTLLGYGSVVLASRFGWHGINTAPR